MKTIIFAQRLQTAMYLKSWTGAELSKRSGLTQAAISRYINGQRQPSVDRIIRLSKALGVTSDYLMGLTDEIRSESA